MSTKHIDTAADLVRFGASVKIECGSCGAAKTLTGVDLVRRCGGVLATFTQSAAGSSASGVG